jgi:hypothetical protein
MKTIVKLASEIAKIEGKKSQARIGDIRELLGILSDLLHEADTMGHYEIIELLRANGEKRARRKPKASK